MHAEDFNELFQNCMPIFIALGDEVRLAIIEGLANTGLYDDLGNGVANISDGLKPQPRQGMNVKEITEMTRLSRPVISHHLKILKEAGLVNVRQEGTANYYYLTIGDSTKKLCSLGQYFQELMNRVS
ncbi:MAG: ArsR family transcriptional regulator [Hungatella sp.]|jgi:DNA-binding transcriptional ArsR family regulator|nr:ArsR family transcriptional regulator [Hungatella sp.]